MNYIVSLFFICLLELSVCAQDPVKYFIIGELKNESIKLAIGQNIYNYDDSIYFRPSKRFDNIVVVFTKTKDTIELINCVDEYCSLDSFGLKAVHFNDKNNAFVFTLKVIENSNYGEAGAYLIKKTVNEIWDIKLQKRIFSALNDYYYFGDFNSYYELDNDWSSHNSETEYSYHYDFEINDKSEVIINGLTSSFKNSESSYLTKPSERDTKYPHYCECLEPDNEMGIYKFDNGKFINNNNK